MQSAQLQTIEQIRNFVFAGHAIFTLRGKLTGDRRTYKVTRADGDNPGRPWFVGVLYGTDNNSDYCYLGTLFPTATAAHYTHGRKSNVPPDVTSAKVASWFFYRLEAGLIDALARGVE